MNIHIDAARVHIATERQHSRKLSAGHDTPLCLEQALHEGGLQFRESQLGVFADQTVGPTIQPPTASVVARLGR